MYNFIREKERDERNQPFDRRLETKLNETERWMYPSRLVCFQGDRNDDERKLKTNRGEKKM